MAPKPENREGGEAKGKGKGKDKGQKGSEGGRKNPPALSKEKALAQIVSLDPTDDERESISKKISWILRKGAGRVKINVQDGGWVKFEDLLNAELLDDMADRSEEKLMSIIKESNEQKLRYELTDDGKLIRALKKEERKSKSGAEPGAKPEDPTPTKLSAPAAQSELRSDAPSFVPAAQAVQAAANASAQAAAAASTMAGAAYPGYPYGWNPYAGAAMAWQGMAAYGNYGYGYGAQASQAGQAQGNGRFQGRIKSFNAEKGFGFIESPEALQIHGRDVFLHKAHIGKFTVGSFVSFAVETNNQGMPQARDVAASDGSGQVTKGKGKGKNKEGGKGKKKDADGNGGEKSEKKPKGKKAKEDKGKGKAEGDGEAGDAAASADKKSEEAPAPAADADKN